MKHLEKNWLEWSVFAAGSVLVLATIGYLAFEAATASGGPAVVEVRLGRAERRGSQFVVPVRVANRGDEAAETVLVEVLLKRDGGVEERARLEIRLLPGRATREGWVTFANDPEGGNLTARAVGYERP